MMTIKELNSSKKNGKKLEDYIDLALLDYLILINQLKMQFLSQNKQLKESGSGQERVADTTTHQWCSSEVFLWT